MDNFNPLVSVIISTRNSARTLAKCLASIKHQSYKNIELIVVDNNSTDNTKSIAQKYADKVFNMGPERSAQRNFGVSQAVGDYLLIIDGDMVLAEKVIENCVDKIQANKNVKGVIIPEESFGEGFWTQCKKLERSYYIGVAWLAAARFFEKKSFLKAGGFDENMVSGEDWDLSQRIEKESKIDMINDLIYHDEGKINLFKTIKKKFYYAKNFINYVDKNKDNEKFKKQTGIFSRYKLFFSHPKKLFRNPILWIGMIFMKTCEFGFGGAGYLINKFQNLK
jgi:glycosyltransferase involved in cell wall biosynthesis